ncbi:3-deoxy-D-manno-octulosonic acid transferase [Rosenbergiella australiborealis]|uniref:3-deoxy-D-manno-octulosonic acid transferase n=1 Tax=Rosenbergiella australiborealis TaxID=1544696 RepID=A0ABS5T4Z9_9GAMM|nr:lipid IV(A) 3-deoxy-D-manno-octulosonic acid transferase [Rosenbergiella australiborealis]MBT0727416.1 3-deoxy-D-manno-octulosonic acid transferase [Rosenbergiella australiborealis]
MLTAVYTLLLYLIQPLIWIRLWHRGKKLPGYRLRWKERYGYCKGKVVPGGIVLHSVSVGETLAAIPLVRALQYQYPSIPITVTTMTPTGSERAQSAFGNNVSHVYLPYDLPTAINRFLDTAAPRLMIIMETELWPNIIHTLHRRHIPLIIANARLSERSAKRYQILGQELAHLLQKISCIAAQNREDADRFLQLGANTEQVSVTGSLKFDISVTPELAAKAVALRRQWAPHRPVWIAASTHEGEERMMLDTHRQLLAQFPDLLLILVPRHPERFQAVKQLAQKIGFTPLMRSENQIPNQETQVLIGDTMGELMLLYGIADVAFVGGSLIERGGHNPLEPAAHAIPVIMGPHTWNFKDICERLERDQGLITVTDQTALIQEMTQLLADHDLRKYYGLHAVEVLHQNQGALQQLLHIVEPYINAHPH